MKANDEQHLKVLDRAFNIYAERNRIHQDLWAQFDVQDALHHCASKLARAKYAVECLEINNRSRCDNVITDEVREHALDSLYDLVNYTVFAIRHITGEKPDASAQA